MNAVKVEIENSSLREDSCFICLQQVAEINEEQFNSLNLFFNYLKIIEIKEAFVCEICGEKLARFEQVCKAFEKVKLEMDYLLGFIQEKILNSNQAKPLSGVRNSVVEKCRRKMEKRRPEIILDRLDLSKLVKKSQSPASDSNDWGDNGVESPNDLKAEVNLEYSIASKAKTSRNPNPSKALTFGNQERLITVNFHFKPHKCDICFKSFTRAWDLKRHKLTPHKSLQPKPPVINSKQFCELCGKTFLNTHSLKTHQRYVHLAKRVPCDICKKIFKDGYDLKRHISAVHEKEKSFCQAPGCDRKYSDTKRLDNHYRTKHPDFTVPPEKLIMPNGDVPKVFKCSTCLKEFKRKEYLRIHMNEVHLRLKPFQCDICGTLFVNSVRLRDHKIAKHLKRQRLNPNAKYSCKICESAFEKVTHLRRHERQVHSDNKYQCDICNKKFANPGYLKVHVSAVHDKQRHYCQVEGCEMSYSQQPDLVKHYKSKHSEFLAPKKPRDVPAKVTIDN